MYGIWKLYLNIVINNSFHAPLLARISSMERTQFATLTLLQTRFPRAVNLQHASYTCMFPYNVIKRLLLLNINNYQFFFKCIQQLSKNVLLKTNATIIRKYFYIGYQLFYISICKENNDTWFLLQVLLFGAYPIGPCIFIVFRTSGSIGFGFLPNLKMWCVEKQILFYIYTNLVTN